MTEEMRTCRYCGKDSPITAYRLQPNHKTHASSRGWKCRECRNKSRGAGSGNGQQVSRDHVCPGCRQFKRGWQFPNFTRAGCDPVCMDCRDTADRNAALDAIPAHERLPQPYRALFANGVAMRPSPVTVVGQRGHLLHVMFDKPLRTGPSRIDYVALCNRNAIISEADGVDVAAIIAKMQAEVERVIAKEI